MATQNKPNKKRYDGKDTQPWKVKTPQGEQVIKEVFDGFASANNAATRFTEQTGEYATAVRS
jgi:hypothetical protein